MESDKKETQIHPAFGQIYFGRTSGHANFYGSELEQDHYITMEVHHSEVDRELSKDWYHTKGLPVVRLRMSSSQFAEAITSLNQGSGVPCTLEMIDGKQVERMPTQESRKEFVHRKFEDRMKDFTKSIKERQTLAKELVKKKTLSKQDIHDLTNHLEWLTGEVERNIPFFAKCFQENMDEVVSEAKMEVENAIQHKITTLGLNALHAENRLLDDGNKK